MNVENLTSLTLTLGSLIASFLIAYLFYSLQKRHAQSATGERALRAKFELIEVLEQYVVSKRALSKESIETLLTASQREYRVDLRNLCSPISLVEDVSFRLQRSPHLDIQQKAEYQVLIDELLKQLHAAGVADAAQGTLALHLERVRSAAGEGNREKLEQELADLELAVRSSLGRRNQPTFYQTKEFSLFSGLAFASGVMIFLRFVRYANFEDGLSPSPLWSLPMGIALACPLSILILNVIDYLSARGRR